MTKLITGYPSSDIRYRGIMTKRGLRLLALLFMTLGVLSRLALAASKFCFVLNVQPIPSWVLTLAGALQNSNVLTMPLLLIATFTDVLHKQENFIKSLITYFIMAALTYLAIVFILYELIHIALYILPATLYTLDSVPDAMDFINKLLAKIISGVIPGNGTIRIEFVNRALNAFGSSLTLPTVSEITTVLETKGIPADITDLVVKMFGNVEPSTYARLITTVFNRLVHLIPENMFLQVVTEAVEPLCSRIGSMLNVNIFWDLFLYTVAFFFIRYKPKKYTSSGLMLFRMCSLLPIGWMIVSFLIAGTARITSVDLPIWLAALLSKQSLSTMLIYLSLLMFEKYAEARYMDNHGTDDKLSEYQNSRLHSLRFSLFLSILLLVVSVMDWGLSKIPGLSYWNIGTASYLWIATPFLLLFSYNKKPKYPILSAAVPVYYVLHYVLLVLLGIGAMNWLADFIA